MPGKNMLTHIPAAEKLFHSQGHISQCSSFCNMCMDFSNFIQTYATVADISAANLPRVTILQKPHANHLEFAGTSIILYGEKKLKVTIIENNCNGAAIEVHITSTVHNLYCTIQRSDGKTIVICSIGLRM